MPSHEGAVPRGMLSHGAEVCRGGHDAMTLPVGVGAGRRQRGMQGCQQGFTEGEVCTGHDGV